MIEIEIPNDIKDYEPKFIGPFTLRQGICLVGIVITSLVFHFIIKNGLKIETGLNIVIPMVFDIPWVLVGWYKPYGMKFEKYFISQLYTTILPPKKRLYKIENLYDKFDKEIDLEEKQKAGIPTKNNSAKKQNKKSKKQEGDA